MTRRLMRKLYLALYFHNLHEQRMYYVYLIADFHGEV